jgi:hypothetical protein
MADFLTVAEFAAETEKTWNTCKAEGKKTFYLPPRGHD